MIKCISRKVDGSKCSINSKIVLSSKLILSSTKQKNSNVKSQGRLKKYIVAKNIDSDRGIKNIQFLQSRKQSLLNSYFNKRKNNLVNITKQNKKIYDRINSQKSNYSSRVLNKSYDSLNSKDSRISNRSLQSKTSYIKKSAKGLSLNNSRNSKIKLTKNCMIKPLMTAQKVNAISKEQILTFNDIFCWKNQSKSSKNLVSSKNRYPDENAIIQIKQFPIQNKTNNKKKHQPYHFTPNEQKKIINHTNIQAYPLPSLKRKIPQRIPSQLKTTKYLGGNYY